MSDLIYNEDTDLTNYSCPISNLNNTTQLYSDNNEYNIQFNQFNSILNNNNEIQNIINSNCFWQVENTASGN